MKKRVDSMLINSEQRMVEALYETLVEEHFGVVSRNLFLKSRPKRNPTVIKERYRI